MRALKKTRAIIQIKALKRPDGYYEKRRAREERHREKALKAAMDIAK